MISSSSSSSSSSCWWSSMKEIERHQFYKFTNKMQQLLLEGLKSRRRSSSDSRRMAPEWSLEQNWNAHLTSIKCKEFPGPNIGINRFVQWCRLYIYSYVTRVSISRNWGFSAQNWCNKLLTTIYKSWGWKIAENPHGQLNQYSRLLHDINSFSGKSQAHDISWPIKLSGNRAYRPIASFNNCKSQ